MDPAEVPAPPEAATALQAPDVDALSPEENQARKSLQVRMPSQAAAMLQVPTPSQVMASPEVPAILQTALAIQAPIEPGSPINSAESRISKTPCDFCKQYGQLFERTCRKLHRGEKTAESIKLLKELSLLDAEERTKMLCFRCRSENIVSLKCRNCILPDVSHAAVLINVSIYDLDFNAIVDTGSTHSVASADVIRHLIANGQHFTYKLLILPILGVRTRQVFRVATVDVIAAGVTIPTMLVDMPGAVTSVLGIDFIQSARLVLDFRGVGSWNIRGGPGPDQVLISEQFNKLQE